MGAFGSKQEFLRAILSAPPISKDVAVERADGQVATVGVH